MKKLIILLFILLTSCQSTKGPMPGTYAFGSSHNGLIRYDTTCGTIEVLTADGWIEVHKLYKKIPLQLERRQ